jgi:L-alanine-DL-glutamate epimerase-like enolase superfamily enzyme
MPSDWFWCGSRLKRTGGRFRNELFLRPMITVASSQLFRAELKTRMPFRYGIATMTQLPHVFLAIEIDVSGARYTGISADHLPPKWFTKEPGRDPLDEIEDMLRVIRHAMAAATGVVARTPFDFWWELHRLQSTWAAVKKIPPLLAHLGTSLVERALLDAWARANQTPFHQLLRDDRLGLDLGRLHSELGGSQAANWLPAQPLARITVRHTVGMVDPLTRDEIEPTERLDDGLPQALEDCIRTYGLRHFKLKVGGRLAEDLSRLERIASVLERDAPPDYACTLDGNEGFPDAAAFREFLSAAAARPRIAALLRHTLFVEQPFHRAIALTPAIGNLSEMEMGLPPLPFIIDESDAEIGSLRQALALGYAGTSHKNCKGVFKGVANACRLAQLRKTQPEGRFVMSGEDLTNIGPVALLQDLAVQAALGISSVERNGHHYFAGLSVWPASVQNAVLAAHGDLYGRGDAGWPRLAITRGEIALDTVNAAPFGAAPWPHPESFAQRLSTES